MGEFDDIIPEYIAESTDLLQTVEGGLLQMESGEVEEEAIHTVFRAIHSIKGGAGFVGLTKIERLAHKMEDLLNLIRNKDLAPSQPITDALLQSLDVLSSLFERVEEHESIDIEGPMRALEAALNAEVDPVLKEGFRKVDTAASPCGMPGFDINEYSLKNKLSQGNVYFMHLDLPRIEERGLTPIQLVNEMLSMGEILDSKVNLPPEELESDQEVQVSFDILYSTVLESDLLEAALRLDEGEFRLLSSDDFGLCDEQEPEAQPIPESAPAPVAAEPENPPSPAAPAPSPKPEIAEAPQAPPPAVVPTPPAEPEPPRRAGEYLTFTLEKENYGVDILSVQEIMAVPHLTKLPRSPHYVLGVMNLRGMVVPVMDMRLRLGLPTETETEPVVVVLNVNDKYMGAVVDSVSDVIEFKEAEIQDPPDFSGAVHREYLRGLCRRDDSLIVLLELDRIIAPESQINVI